MTTPTPQFVVRDMVAYGGGGGLSIAFVVKGTPPVQKRHVTVWKGRPVPFQYDPSAGEKEKFANAVRLEMAAMGLTAFPYFTDSTALKVNLKFVLPRPKKEVVLRPPAPPQLVQGACPFPRGKDLDNMLKFVGDALQGTLYKDDTVIVRGGDLQKCYSPNLKDKVGWTEVHFIKVTYN
jgi:Holliday junction resolvase RusA-like endonuclease